MLCAILFLALVVGLGLRVARWVDGLPGRAIGAVHSDAEPRRRRPFGLFGSVL